MSIIRGVPPTASQKLLLTAAASLAPDTTLATLDSLARLILGSVVLATSVLTGFGLFTDVASRFREQPAVLEAPVLLAVASAIAALLALVPWVGRVDPDNLNSLRRLFTGLVLIRTILVLAGLVMLLAAIVAAGVGARHYLTEGGPSHPQISLIRSASTDGTSVTASVTETGAPAGALAEVRVTSGAANSELGQASMVVGSTGEVDIAVTVPKVADAANLKLSFVLTVNGNAVVQTTAALGDRP